MQLARVRTWGFIWVGIPKSEWSQFLQEQKWGLQISIQVYLGYCITPSNYSTSLRECAEKSCWSSLAWWRRLYNSLDLWQCVIFKSGVGNVGKQHLWLAAFTWGSDCIDLGAVSLVVFWRQACGWQKLPGIWHDSPSNKGISFLLSSK
jgi:hypothetical protein